MGFILLSAGSALRWMCFQRLGSFYTFELSVKSNHKLITQGPYSIVRHPGYSGAMLASCGVIMLQVGRGSWLLECGARNSWLWPSLEAFHLIVTVVFAVGLFGRCKAEDAVMEAHFKGDWVQWSQRTRYRMFP